MTASPDPLDGAALAQAWAALLPSGQGEGGARLFLPQHHHFLSSVASTNTHLAELALAGAPEGCLVVAERQTGGRGRQGRPWFSPPGLNLAFSLLLRPPLPPRLAPQLTLLAGLALADSVATLLPGDRLRLKWPNDLLIDGRKVAGILTEWQRGAAVVGVGVNVNATLAHLPPQVQASAGSLRVASGRCWPRSTILARFLLNMGGRYHAFLTDGLAAVRPDWQRYAGVPGVEVRIQQADGVLAGVAEGLDEAGFLLVRGADGQVRRVVSGDLE